MILEKFSLTGKKGIVTGAGSGIGKAMARSLVEAGAEVVIAGRNLERLQAVAKEIASGGKDQVTAIRADMSDPDSIQALTDEAQARLGRLDFLFNNAGNIFRAPTEDFPKEEWDKVIAVNLTGPFLLAQKVAKHMIEKGIKGSIVNTSSLLSVFGGKTVPAYAASKGGLTQVTKTMCNDWGKYGIRANAIAPGWVKTDLTQQLREDEGRFHEISIRIPLERWADPEDLAGAVVFLASDASSYITGQVIFVDGGYTAM
jgi:2-deoxy-D-gluconate 3-dehydrogenase